MPTVPDNRPEDEEFERSLAARPVQATKIEQGDVTFPMAQTGSYQYGKYSVSEFKSLRKHIDDSTYQAQEAAPAIAYGIGSKVKPEQWEQFLKETPKSSRIEQGQTTEVPMSVKGLDFADPQERANLRRAWQRQLNRGYPTTEDDSMGLPGPVGGQGFAKYDPSTIPLPRKRPKKREE